MENDRTYSTFAGDHCISSGGLVATLLATKEIFDREPQTPLLVFDDETGRQIDFDLSGTPDEVLARELRAHRSEGPSLDPRRVEPRSVALLARHWEWLAAQECGIDAALRRIVEEARKRDPEQQRVRRSRDAAYRFMSALCGDRENYEEALRALYDGNLERLQTLTREWPLDIQRHLARLLDL